jgi:hypothetical protein
MTNDSTAAEGPTTGTPSSTKDEQDQVFGRQAEDRKKAAEDAHQDHAASEDRPSEPHAGGKA